MKTISFKTSKTDAALITKIARRAVVMAKAHGSRQYDMMTADMDLTACHANGNPLDLEKLLAAAGKGGNFDPDGTGAIMIQKLEHPRKDCVPLAIGLGWGHDGAIYQEKIDGDFTAREFGGGHLMAGGALLAGDTVRGEFIAWDCLGIDGQDIRGIGAWERLAALFACRERFGVRVADYSPDGAAILQAVLARGGEGIVRKLPHATYYDAMTACKRLQTWRCRVVALNYATGGATIADVDTGEARGTCPLRARAVQCRVGSIIKVEGLELHAGGKIRDPRPCQDTETSWLIKL